MSMRERLLNKNGNLFKICWHFCNSVCFIFIFEEHPELRLNNNRHAFGTTSNYIILKLIYIAVLELVRRACSRI